jgi:hypothetical protein
MTSTLIAAPPAPGAETLRDQLVADFAAAHRQLTAARQRQAGKDTPGHRAAVTECRACVDALLDMYLDQLSEVVGR